MRQDHRKPCRSCGVVIEFMVNKATGRKIPMDTRVEVYRMIAPATQNEAALVERDESCVVSHFRLCPQASEHSRPKGQEQPFNPPTGKELAAGKD